MGLLAVFGIRPPRPGDDSVANRAILAAFSGAAIAHNTLRRNLRTDPFFAGIICKAMGCAHPDCQAPLPALIERAHQIPPIVDRLSEGSAPVLPALGRRADG